VRSGAKQMNIPGSDVEITLQFDRVVLADSSTSKMIEFKGRTFEDVLTDVQSFIYIRGFDTARRLLKFILLRVGLPNVTEFPRDDELNEDDMDELSEVLEDIDTLSDRFLSAKFQDDTSGLDDIPEVKETVREEEVLPNPSIWESQEPIELVFKFTPENLPAKERHSVVRNDVDWESARFPVFDCTYDNEVEVLKIIILGESCVGKKTLLATAGFGSHCVQLSDVENANHGNIYSRIVEHNGSNYRIDAWAAKDHPTKEFFANTSIMVIVYSVVDRSSFQSIDYWIEEASRVLLNVPPILLIANKADLREGNSDSNPVLSEEGFQMKKLIEEKLGTHRCIHPIHFIETSCKREIGIEEAVRKILTLWLENEKIVLPLID